MPAHRCVYIVAPTSAGSLGDQALFQGLADGIEEILGKVELIEILIKRKHRPQLLRSGALPTVQYHSGSHLAHFLLRRRLKNAIAVVIVGADTLDGSYALKKNLAWFKLADLSASLGIPTSIISFSFSTRPVTRAVERLKKLNPAVRFCSRDPVSKLRFETATGQACALTADLAFLMKPAAMHNQVVSKWVEEQRRATSLIVGLNVNPLGLHDRRAEMLQSYSQALTKFLTDHSDISILMIPHDFRGGQSDQSVMADIKNALPAKLRDRALIVEGPFDAWDAKKLVSEVDLLVTGRMHLAIAAMSQGVPAFGLAYKDKFEGLMQHFSLTGNLLPREKALEPSTLLSFLNEAVNAHEAVRATIAEHLPSIRAKSLKNLDVLARHASPLEQSSINVSPMKP